MYRLWKCWRTNRPHKDNWRKAFIAIIIINTVNLNAAGAYLQKLGQRFAQNQASDLSQYGYFPFFYINLKGIDLWNREIKSSKSLRIFLPWWKYFIRASHLQFCSILKGVFKQGDAHGHCDSFFLNYNVQFFRPCHSAGGFLQFLHMYTLELLLLSSDFFIQNSFVHFLKFCLIVS